MGNCLFCKISRKEISADILYEDDEVLAFRDIKPIAPVHVLIIPKEHIASITDISGEHVELLGKIILTAKKIADKLGISENGYKLLFRVGRHGGQEVAHIHLHLLGGSMLSEEIKPV